MRLKHNAEKRIMHDGKSHHAERQQPMQRISVQETRPERPPKVDEPAAVAAEQEGAPSAGDPFAGLDSPR